MNFCRIVPSFEKELGQGMYEWEMGKGQERKVKFKQCKILKEGSKA